MRILIHHDGALGDLLLSLPCLRMIREQAELITLVGRSDISKLLLEAGLVDRIISSDSSLFTSLYMQSPDRTITDFLASFDLSYVFSIRNDSPVATRIRALVPDTRTVITVPSAGTKLHVSDFRINQLNTDRELCSAPLQIPRRHSEQIRSFLIGSGVQPGKPIITIHPGSGGTRKCWTLENYFALIEKLQQTLFAYTIILSGPVEEGLTLEKIDSFARDRQNVLSVSGRPLIEAAALISMSWCHIGNDSGITHLAAAVNTPTVALFGPTNPAFWGPRGTRVQILSAPDPARSLDSISPDEVLSAATRLLVGPGG